MDHLSRSMLNYFSLQPLDRTAHLRTSDNWLTSQAQKPDTQFYLLNNESIVVKEGTPIILNYAELIEHQLNDKKCYYLGTNKQNTCFAVNLTDINDLKAHRPQSASLRDLADKIDMPTASILAYAQLMNHWHLTTKHCRRCGSLFNLTQGGHVLECSSADCKHVEFPRINPAVIMRVTCGDKILLARQKSWPENRYSVLAGFVEPGETLEHAVHREVKEESGIDVDTVHYHSSQPWPFPNSLMIGYTAKTNLMELDIEDDDLETAIWLNPDELAQEMDSRNVILSPPISISHRLIEDWFMEKTGRSIKEWQDIKPEHITHENE